MLCKNFRYLFWLLSRNIFCRTSFLWSSHAGYLFYRKLFFDEPDQRFFNISNFISSCSQEFDHSDVFKKLHKIQRKHLHKSVFLIKLQTFSLQFENLIKKETSALAFPCNFCEIFKNTFFIEQLCLTAFVTLTLVKQTFQFIVRFPPTFVACQIFYQTK